jgi:hypothetical protein
MTMFKAYLNKDLVDIFTNRFETLRTFTEVVGTKLLRCHVGQAHRNGGRTVQDVRRAIDANMAQSH